MMKFRFNTGKLSIRELIELRKLEYKRLKPQKCPLMGGELVYFNKHGFHHLTHDGRDRIRKESDQRMRLNLLPNVLTVIKKAKFFGSLERIVPPEANKEHKIMRYYEITYKFSPRKTVSVILRRVGDGGQLHYYSVRFYNKSKKTK